mmetsp:Transcript_38606/g.93548  ORF Transcript_38606/g.93548 Transcript_38606/m.93548 type:complete len:338 (+) Transcript_38606:197-1210(+)
MMTRPLTTASSVLSTAMTMKTTTAATATATGNLAKARALPVPTYDETLVRHPKVSKFWDDNSDMLVEAWKEWDNTNNTKLTPLDVTALLDPSFRSAVEAAWKDPTREDAVRKLWKEVAPGVYTTQFFDVDKLSTLRDYFDTAVRSGIPVRPPHGILLNRNGIMLDPRSVGYLAAPSFQDFYQQIMNKYMRPIGRLLFPKYINERDDSQTFGFSIEYQPTTEQGIRMHSDSSALTLNINTNLPGETWEGSQLIFPDIGAQQMNTVEFGPGVAVIHRGATMHAALPLTKGKRTNLVFWLYGLYGSVNRDGPYSVEEKLSQAERWSVPEFPIEQDSWAPF